MAQVQCGHFQGSGADVDLPLGFKPDYLVLINQNAAGGEVAKIEWFGEEQGVIKEFHWTVTDGSNETNFAYVTAGDINAVTETSTPTIVSANQQVTGGWGITIDSTFMGTDDDEVWYMAMRADKVVDHGDINA